MSKSTLLTSPKIVAYINGRALGLVTSFRWSGDTPMKPANGLDNITPLELMPTNARCTGSMGLLRQSLDGGVEARGMTAHSSQVVRERYYTLTLIDRTTDTTIFRADFCMTTNQSWEVPERGFVKGQVNFEALSWSNECKLAP